MVQQDNIFFDWIDVGVGTHLTWVADIVPEVASGLTVAVVTCVDSGRGKNLAEYPLLKSFVGSHRSARFLPCGVLMTVADYSELSQNNDLFTGWDEVWFFESEPTIGPGEPPRMTSETRIDDPADESGRSVVAQWMLESGCHLALGDGHGLNIATRDRDRILQIECHLLDPDGKPIAWAELDRPEEG